jgi:hypothetical protein
VNTLLADPPAAPSSEQPTASGPAPPSAETSPGAGPPAQTQVEDAPAHACAHCGAPLQEGQQWCLNCGACEPGSLGERPNWRPLSALALTAALLVAGAAIATAAALGKHNSSPHPATVALIPAKPALTTPPTASTPTTPGLPASTSPSAPAGAQSSPKGSSTGSSTANNLLFPPASATKPPKIPAPAATPKATGGSGAAGKSGSESTATTPANTNTTETGSSTTESPSNSGSGKSEQPSPILLDTNAATTYNPYNYPEAGFGDPALAIDGEPSTAWTAQVQASSFPKMAEGLLIDLRSPTKVGRVEIRTPTRKMSVQVFAANGAKAPATITAPGWTQLSATHVLKKRVTHLKFRDAGKAFRWLLVWVVHAPSASRGTAAVPGHVALSEVALYPPAS